MNKSKSRSKQIPKPSGFMWILLLIILALVIGASFVWMQFFQPSKLPDADQNGPGQVSETPTTTKITHQPTPTITPIVFPQIDTSDWKTYVEQGGRRDSIPSLDGDDVYSVVDNYKKYVFKYPADWTLEVSEPFWNKNVMIKKPNSDYFVEVNYNGARDYRSEIVYELDNGVIVEAFDQYDSDTVGYYLYGNRFDRYDVIIEPPDGRSIVVDVYIVDKDGNFYDLLDIATARMIVKSFEPVD